MGKSAKSGRVAGWAVAPGGRYLPLWLVLWALTCPATGSTQSLGDIPAVRPDVSAVRPGMAHAWQAPEPPTIDGLPDDPVWLRAPVVSGFRQWEPRLDADPSFPTEFQVAFDARNLFVFVRAYDPAPDSIMRALTRRDVRGPSDQITVFIDSYHDRRSGYHFNVNPDGVQRDFAVYNDGDEDGSWNGIWDVATTVDSLGWTAEFRIPLSQLRYADAASHTFGFGVWRDIERLQERVAWPEYSRTRPGLMSQLGTLEGLTGITSSRPLELTPYLVTRNVTSVDPGGGFGRAQDVTVGGDLKLGITPNLTLDATVNPDFGQVEADPAVLNLTAFETFLSERRPFFVEGTGFYRFALNCYIVVDCGTNEGLFYSRRIGRAPSLRGDYGDASTPTSTPIAAAAKLTGRTRGGLSFGLLDAVTRHVGAADGPTVEPRSNYAVLRAQQDLRGGEAEVGLIATAVNRSLDAWTAPRLHSSAYAAGLGFRNRFAGGNYEVAGSLTASRVAGAPEAMRRTQESAARYFQQPGDDLLVDAARTSLSGHAEQLKVGKYGGGFTRFETSLVRQSAGFDVNDLGFLRRADRLNWSTWASLNFQEPKWFYRWASVNFNHWDTWTTSGLRIENGWNVNAHVGLENNWNFHAGASLEAVGEVFCDRCTRGGPALRQARGLYPWFGVNGDDRRMLVPSMWVNLWYTDDGQSYGSSIEPSIGFRPLPSLQSSLGVRVERDQNHTQWFGNFEDGPGLTHHAFAHLDQRTISVNARINYTASRDLTFELYAQPFVSTGIYSDFREVSATPRAGAYADRFQPYAPPADAEDAFKTAQLRTNAVLRWEYRPGSTIFLVWAHGREASTDEARRGWGRDFRDLFALHPDNTFLVKVAHWFNW